MEACCDIANLYNHMCSQGTAILVEALDFTHSEAVALISSEFDAHLSQQFEVNHLLYDLVAKGDVLGKPAQIIRFFTTTHQHAISLLRTVLDPTIAEAQMLIVGVLEDFSQAMEMLGSLLHVLVFEVNKRGGCHDRSRASQRT